MLCWHHMSCSMQAGRGVCACWTRATVTTASGAFLHIQHIRPTGQTRFANVLSPRPRKKGKNLHTSAFLRYVNIITILCAPWSQVPAAGRQLPQMWHHVSTEKAASATSSIFSLGSSHSLMKNVNIARYHSFSAPNMPPT